MPIDDLQKQVSALTDRVNRSSERAIRVTQGETSSSPSNQTPFWDCTYCTGLTLTTGAGLDWDPLFDNRSASNWMRYRLDASYGSFDHGNLGFAAQRRWVLNWDSSYSGDVKCLLAGTSVYTADADAPIQVKMNGVLTEYAAGSGPFGNVAQMITLKVIQGRNRLAISADIHPDTVQFAGELFRDSNDWVDPLGQPGYI